MVRMYNVFVLISIFSFVANCQSISTLAIGRATIDSAWRIEEEFARNDSAEAPQGESWFKVVETGSSVLVTAGHSTAIFRDDHIRFPDGGTGSLAIMLNHWTSCNVIYNVYRAPEDPNRDIGVFKESIDSIIQRNDIRLVIDLHASDPDRPYDVDLGTMNGRSLVGHDSLEQKLESILRLSGLGFISHNYFAGSKNNTIIKHISQQGIPAIQLEINGTCLLFDGAVDSIQRNRFSKLLNALIQYIVSQSKNKW